MALVKITEVVTLSKASNEYCAITRIERTCSYSTGMLLIRDYYVFIDMKASLAKYFHILKPIDRNEKEMS